jgi:hypothetical protein
MGMKSLAHCYCKFEAQCPITEASLRICYDGSYKCWSDRSLSLIQLINLSRSKLSLLQKMASNDNDKRKLEEAESSTVRKRLQVSNNDGGDDDSSYSPEEETEEEVEEEEEMELEVTLKELSMNHLDTSKEKLLVKCGCDIIIGDDGDTTSPSSEPHTPETPSSHMRSDPDSSDDDDDDDVDDDFWM